MTQTSLLKFENPPIIDVDHEEQLLSFSAIPIKPGTALDLIGFCKTNSLAMPTLSEIVSLVHRVIFYEIKNNEEIGFENKALDKGIYESISSYSPLSSTGVYFDKDTDRLWIKDNPEVISTTAGEYHKLEKKHWYSNVPLQIPVMDVKMLENALEEKDSSIRFVDKKNCIKTEYDKGDEFNLQQNQFLIGILGIRGAQKYAEILSKKGSRKYEISFDLTTTFQNAPYLLKFSPSGYNIFNNTSESSAREFEYTFPIIKRSNS